jgi:hypothetical protein
MCGDYGTYSPQPQDIISALYAVVRQAIHRTSPSPLIANHVYSIMLYMKTRVTFRVADDLAEALRRLPNQTAFVEEALRAALGRTCPACDGSGRIQWRSVSVSDFKRGALPRLDRDGAVQLKGLIRLARELAASKLDLSKDDAAPGLSFALSRGESVLMRGTVQSRGATFQPS